MPLAWIPAATPCPRLGQVQKTALLLCHHQLKGAPQVQLQARHVRNVLARWKSYSALCLHTQKKMSRWKELPNVGCQPKTGGTKQQSLAVRKESQKSTFISRKLFAELSVGGNFRFCWGFSTDIGCIHRTMNQRSRLDKSSQKSRMLTFKDSSKSMPENTRNILWKKAKTRRCISGCCHERAEGSNTLAVPSACQRSPGMAQLLICLRLTGQSCLWELGGSSLRVS